MSFLIKLVYPALATLTIGGGAYVGATSSSSNGIPSSNVSLALELNSEALNQRRTSQEPSQPQLDTVIEETHSQVEARVAEASTHLSTTEISSDTHLHTTISETGLPEETQVTMGVTDPNPESKGDHLLLPKFSTGNCEVIDTPEGVKKQLPKDIVYVAFSCKNNTGRTDLVDWKGYFPSALLMEGIEALKTGDRIDIDVFDVEDSAKRYEEAQLQDDEDALKEEPLWTLFESYQFKEQTITGNWGDSVASDDIEAEEDEIEEDEEGETVYKVRLPESINADRFYLQY